MHPLIETLLANAPVITDGAWGTELAKLGLPTGELPDRWNVENPKAVSTVASSYVEAGSRIILTNTFGSNRIRLAEYGLDGHLTDINRAGARISLEAAGDRAKVFASIGPTGKMIFAGEVEPEQVLDAFREQASLLAEEGVHGFVIETMSDLQEAQLALQAIKPLGLPVVVCMTFDTGPDSDRTMMGITPEQAAQTLSECGADVIGANCGSGIDKFQKVLAGLQKGTNKPIWLKPNAGLPKLENGRTVYDTPPIRFVEKAIELAQAGAAFIGGCCGTTPEFIRLLSERIQSLKSPDC